MLKTIKSLYTRCRYWPIMRGYIKELKKDRYYVFTAEDAFNELEEKMTIERITNSFTINVPEEGIQSIVGDDKASFVSYNGVPYNKQKK